jgi:hypothetical protein
MAPQADTLKNALEGGIAGEPNEQRAERAAVAYDKYQKCGLRGARNFWSLVVLRPGSRIPSGTFLSVR